MIVRAPDPREWDRLRTVARGGALLVVAIALAAIAGWYGGIEVLVRVRSHYSAMVPATAICFALSGFGLFVCASRPAGWRAATGMTFAFVVALLALVNLTPLGGAFGGLAALLSPAELSDRMAVGTSIFFVLAAIALAGVARPRIVPAAVLQLVATLGIASSLVALSGYITGAQALYTNYIFSAMALHTALCFAVFFLAALLARPQETWFGLLWGPTGGGRTARRLMPGVVGAPLLLVAMARTATEYGVLTPDVRFGLFVVALFGVSAAALVHGARVSDEAEQQELLEQERLEGILEGVNAALFAVDTQDASIRFANRRGQALADGSGSPWQWLATARFVDPATLAPLAETQRPLVRVAAGEPLEDETVCYLGGEGQERVLRLSAGPPATFAGRSIRVLSMTDITGEQKMRDRLARAERLEALGQLSGGIAHDMANVLGIIRLSADVGARAADPERMRRQFESIQAACLRGADLTHRILAFARRQPDQAGVVDLVIFARQLYRLGRKTIPSSIDLKLDLAVPAGRALAFVEASQFESALLNLLLNARNAIVEDGGEPSIVLGVRAPDDNRVEIFVRDDGPGMSPEVLRRATDPFFTTRVDAGGTGLGLAMVESFAEQAKGELAIRSALGEGTEVTLVLPRVSGVAAEVETVAQGPDDLVGVSVMLVEDDPGYKSVLVLALTARGADVSAYRTAREAIAALRDGLTCDVLLTDVILRGGVNGFAVANIARELHPDLPIIYLSGYADTAAQAEHHTPGVYLRKPIGGDDLVREILRARDARR